MRKFWLAAATVMFLTPACAADDTLSLYQAGKYPQAIASGVASNTASGFALAARASLADAMSRDQPCLNCLKRAESFARKAVAADPKLPDGHTFLATALGYQARIVGVVRARLAGYAEEARKNLDAALASDPHNAFALEALGAWNIEVVRGGGASLARWLYGADQATGRAYFAKAFKAMPDNVMLRYQYALALSGLDLDANRAEVTDALSRCVNGQPLTAYERLAQDRARLLQRALQKGDRAGFDAMVRHDQGYPG